MQNTIEICFLDGTLAPWKPGKVVCVGRNYAEHARELNNPVPTSPILFMKPATSIVDVESGIELPVGRGAVHYELELAILVGHTLSHASEAACQEAIAGIGLALDLTLREEQAKLKEKGHPWELSKCFDGACPLSRFAPVSSVVDYRNLQFRMMMNGELRQDGHTADMLFPVLPLMSHISRYFRLEPGDIVLTGTPKGVGELPCGASVELELVDYFSVKAGKIENQPLR